MQSPSPSIISRILLLWLSPFIRKNATRAITAGELLELPVAIQAAEETRELTRRIAHYGTAGFGLHRAILFHLRGGIFRVFLLSGILLVSTLSAPLFLRTLISVLQGHPLKDGTALASFSQLFPLSQRSAQALSVGLLLYLNTMLTILTVHHLFLQQLVMSLRVKLALTGVIYAKTLAIERGERKTATNGFILNLAGVDVQKVHWFFTLLHSIWFHPTQIAGVLFLLYGLVGVAALYGAGVIAVILFGCSIITRFQAGIRRQMMQYADARVGLMNEVLTHIKSVKFSAWEEEFAERIETLRRQELQKARQLTFLSAINTFASNSSPALAMVVTLTQLVVRGGVLDAAIIFPTLAFLMTLRFAVGVLPDTLFNLAETHVALGRLSSLLNAKEWQPLQISTNAGGSIELHDARFRWDRETEALHISNLTVRAGELVAVVGSVGSGKSALLLGILGEIELSSGTSHADGSIAYVAQQPWIVSDTIRENILSGRPFEDVRYRRAVQLSGLEPDLAILPQGDSTLIGERGVNLSGGQRQRLAIARAYYSDAAIYLLDDPLSALDPVVANAVFQDLIIGELQQTARVLVTHRLEYALRADRVLVIEDGAVVDFGPPEILQSQESRFKELFDFHTQSHGTLGWQSAASESAGMSVSTEFVLDENGNEGGIIIVAEERETGSVNRKIFREYQQRFVPGILVVVLFLLFFFRQILAVSTDIWLATYSSMPEFSHTWFIGGYCTIVIALCAFNFSRALFVLFRGLRAGQESHHALLHGVLGAPLRFFESNPVGRILNRFSRDLETVDSALPRSILDALASLFDVCSVLLTITIVQPFTVIFIAPILWVYSRMLRLIRPTSRELQRLDSVTRSPIFGQLSESLNGIETIRAYGLRSLFMQRFFVHLDLNGRAFYSIICSNRWLGIRLESLGALVVLVASLSSIGISQTPLGTALAGFIVSYAMSITGAMNWLVRMISQTESSLTSFERIQTYAGLPQERAGGIAPAPPWPSQGALTLTGVGVRYRRDLPLVLRSVSAAVHPGERVGIVGRTGSGKSTLILTLLRLLESEQGTVEIDGIDIATVPLRVLRTAITVIPQEPVLFSGTIRQNIDPFLRYTDVELWDVLVRVELAAFITSLPLALAAPVQEGGMNLSIGQRQLLCMARALLRRSPVIILDEATAHIDVESDVAVQRTIRREFAQSTVLVIAHRIGTIMDSDRVMVFDRGELREFDTPAHLLAEPASAFRALARESRVR